MYLSSLLIDMGENPDRPRPGRLWLRNVYHVHQRLCMAFPSAERKSEDEEFLKPYKPEDFPESRHRACEKKTEQNREILRQVHAPRGADTGFLFRIDPIPGGRAVILVQSALEPDWDYAFRNAGCLLAAPPEVKAFDPDYREGQRLRFRLLANPTRRLSKNSLGANGQPIDEKDVGKRVPVRNDQLLDWLVRRIEPFGTVDKDLATVQPGYVCFSKKQSGEGTRLRSVRYDGVLTVKNPERLRAAIVQGIGSGKGFGFGLLSIAPAG